MGIQSAGGASLPRVYPEGCAALQHCLNNCKEGTLFLGGGPLVSLQYYLVLLARKHSHMTKSLREGGGTRHSRDVALDMQASLY